jgi:hypothetical protein
MSAATMFATHAAACSARAERASGFIENLALIRIKRLLQLSRRIGYRA